jgi:hypothetical protein
MDWSWRAITAASARRVPEVVGGSVKSARWACVPIARTRALNAACGEDFAFAAAAPEPTTIATPATSKESLQRHPTAAA